MVDASAILAILFQEPEADAMARRLPRHEVSHAAVLRLAITNRLTASDAACLRLARKLGAPLVTLDARLAAAA